MNKLTIHINVPRAAAVSSGHVLYGDATYEPAPEELAELDAVERQHLLRFEGADAAARLQLDCYSPDLWTVIVRALKKDLVDYGIEQAANDLRTEERAKGKAAIQTWATDGQKVLLDLVLPALDGYDISGSYITGVAEIVRGLDLELDRAGRPETFNADRFHARVAIEVRSSPKLFALTVETRLRALLTQLLARLAAGTILGTSPVVRMTFGAERNLTALLVTVSHPATPTQAVVVWPAEEASEATSLAMADLASTVDPPASA